MLGVGLGSGPKGGASGSSTPPPPPRSPPRGEPCGKTLPFGFAAIPPVMGNRPVMTHFSALTADVGAGGSIPWLPAASPTRSSWAPSKTLSQVRVTCDHTPQPLPGPSSNPARQPDDPVPGPPFLPLGQPQGYSGSPRYSPLLNDSQNLPSWEKGDDTGPAVRFSPKDLSSQGNSPPPCLASAAASQPPESRSTSPPFIWPH